MFNYNYIRSIVIVFSVLILSTSIGVYSEKINPNKQEMWDVMSAEVNHWIDGAGYPIDKGIKETVIALNLMAIETIASCEGHLDRDLLYPWIEIQIYPLEVKKMMQEFSDIQEQLNNEEMLLKTNFPKLSYNDLYNIPEAENLRKLKKKHSLMTQSIKQIQMKCLEPLNKLLNQFYENHRTSYDKTLIASFKSFAFLHSIGADRQQIRSPEEQSFNLTEYQEEMRAFTAFLKEKFMDSN